jgi:hypothetical protein
MVAAALPDERDDAFAAEVADSDTCGAVVRIEIAGGEADPDRLPVAMRPLGWWFPSVGSSGARTRRAAPRSSSPRSVPHVRSARHAMLRSRERLRGFDAIGRACHGQLDEIDPRRLRALLAAGTEAWQDVPDVLQLAACCQATADLRLALDAADHAAIAERLEATIGAAPHSLGATYAALMLRTLGR